MTPVPSCSIIDAMIWSRPVPPAAAGIDVARAPGRVWLRGEHDDRETEAAFLARSRREAAAAGFARIEVSGHVNVAEE